jgi:hypothetical protein
MIGRAQGSADVRSNDGPGQVVNGTGGLHLSQPIRYTEASSLSGSRWLFLSSSMVEHPAVNRRVPGSSPG